MRPSGAKIVGKVERRSVGEQDGAVNEGERVDDAEDGGVATDDGHRRVAADVSVTLNADATVDHEGARSSTRGGRGVVHIHIARIETDIARERVGRSSRPD